MKGRFRCSRLAQKVYAGGILFCGVVAAILYVGGSFSSIEENTAAAVGAPTRKLLSAGVEIIPGFIGSKCGSNAYFDCPAATTNGRTIQIPKDEYKKCKSKAGVDVGPAITWANAGGAYKQWEADSGGIVYVLVSIYLFLGIAIICDGQFIDALTMICSRYGLGLPPDVAGATFMAAGSSAPELATSFLGVFVAQSPVGLGTILGSAVFNILIIIGAVAILTGEPLKLDKRPVYRDNFFYAVSVIMLCILLAVDDQANLVDTILLLLWYTAYIVYLAFNDTLQDTIFGPKEDEEDDTGPTEVPLDAAAEANPASEMPMTPTMGDDDIAREGPPDVTQDEPPAAAEGDPSASTEGAPTGMGKGMMADAESTPASPPAAGVEEVGVELEAEGAAAPAEAIEGGEDKKPKKQPSFSTGRFRDDDEGEKEDGEEEEEEPKGALDIVLDVFSWPWIQIFDWTIPDCHIELDEDEDNEWVQMYNELKASNPEKAKEEWDKAWDELECGQKWFWASFFVSLIHITWISYFMVEMMLKIGCLWGIPDVVMGLTFLAMGTSIPDALGSISVAQDGEGDMAVSNAVGSNVFDICMGLGLPWFIKLAIDAGTDCNYIPIWQASKDVIPSIIILLSIIVILFIVFFVGNWVLYPESGYVLFGAYALFIIYQLLNNYVINKDPVPCADLCCH